MGYLGRNNVHLQPFSDIYVKNFSVKVLKTPFFIFWLKTCVSYANFWNFSKKKLQWAFWDQNEPVNQVTAWI